ncbi:MAG: hypothetical protein AB9880_06580 [Christensenellales bacterium]
MGVLILMLLLAVTAMALTDAGSISFTMGIDPASLKAPGDVKVSLRVANVGTEDITVPMTLYDADDKIVTAAFDGGAIASLKVNEVVSWEGVWRVSQKHLDAGRITFNLRLNTEDTTGAIAQVSIAAAAPIAFEGDKVDLQVTRVIAPEVVRKGDNVVVTYTLQNKGNVGLKEIIVRENRLIATQPGSIAALAAGATSQVSFTKKVGATSLESSAVITYKKEGTNTELKQTVDLAGIPIAKPGFSSELTADKTTLTVGEKVLLTLTLKNTGNISYRNIQVTDAKLGAVFSDLSLPAGETLVQTKEVTMMAPVTFKFSLAMEDNTGRKQTETTNEMKVSAYAQGQIMRLNVQASADTLAVETLPGLVRFTILVTNDSSTMAKPVNIYHGATQIAALGELTAGQSLSVTRDFSLSQAGKYRFSARTVDALGNVVSFDANELSISYAPPTPAPTKQIVPTVAPIVTYSPIPLAGGGDDLAGKGRDTLFVLAIALGLLFALSLVLFLISSFMRAKVRAQSNAAYDHLEVAEKRDYKDPSTYQGTDLEEAAAPTGEAVTASPAPEPLREALPHEKYLNAQPPKAAEPLDSASAPAEGPVTASDEGAAYRLTREEPEGESAESAEHRSRRAAKHHQLPGDEG